MTDVVFDEEKNSTVSLGATRMQRDTRNMLVRAGIVKTDGQANMVLIGLAAIIILVSVFIYIHANPLRSKPTPAETEEFLKMKQLGEPL